MKVYVIVDTKVGEAWSRLNDFTNFFPDVIQYLNEEGANKEKDSLQKRYPEKKLIVKPFTV